MPKLNVFLRELTESIGLKDQDLDALLGASGLKDLDLKDEHATLINSKLYTKERALADPAIVKQARMTEKSILLGEVDEKLKAIWPKFSEDTQKKIVAEKDSLKRLDLIKDAIDSVATGAEAKTGEAARKTEKDLRDKIAELEGLIVTGKTAHQAELDRFKLLTVVKSKIFAHNIDKPFETIKDTIANGVIDKLVGKYKLKLNDAGSDVDLLQEVEGQLKDVYEGTNTKLTFQTALEREMAPFVVKNSNGGTGGGQPPKGQGTHTQRTANPNPTLEEMRVQQAQGSPVL